MTWWSCQQWGLSFHILWPVSHLAGIEAYDGNDTCSHFVVCFTLPFTCYSNESTRLAMTWEVTWKLFGILLLVSYYVSQVIGVKAFDKEINAPCFTFCNIYRIISHMLQERWDDDMGNVFFFSHLVTCFTCYRNGNVWWGTTWKVIPARRSVWPWRSYGSWWNTEAMRDIRKYRTITVGHWSCVNDSEHHQMMVCEVW